MINRILAVGDSFTYGEELDDHDCAWPSLVATALSARLDNQASPGTGNTSIVRNVVNAVLSSSPPELVLIGWSSAGRIEFADDAGIFDTWPGYQGKMFRMFEPWREHLVEYISKNHNPKYLYKQFLVNVILIQEFLQHSNIKYIMVNTIANEFYRNNALGDFSELTAKIDQSRFPGWPESGMTEWAYGKPVGPNWHFLDAGHQIVANKVLAKIKELGWM